MINALFEWVKTFWPAMKNELRALVLNQGCTTQISGGPKKNFGRAQGPKRYVFTQSKGAIILGKKLKAQNFRLGGPNKKLMRATFGPRAVCCACLFYRVHYGI